MKLRTEHTKEKQESEREQNLCLAILLRTDPTRTAKDFILKKQVYNRDNYDSNIWNWVLLPIMGNC